MRALIAGLLAIGLAVMPIGCDAPEPEEDVSVYEKAIDGPLAPPPGEIVLSDAPLPRRMPAAEAESVEPAAPEEAPAAVEVVPPEAAAAPPAAPSEEPAPALPKW